MAEEKTKTEGRFEAVKVPTQHTVAIQTPKEDLLSLEEAVALLLNEVTQIKKLVG